MHNCLNRVQNAFGFFSAGGTVEQFIAILAGSQEYFQNRGGASNNGFLSALFQDALGRAIGPGGLAFFGGELPKLVVDLPSFKPYGSCGQTGARSDPQQDSQGFIGDALDAGTNSNAARASAASRPDLDKLCFVCR